jgi:hypothetical protein
VLRALAGDRERVKNYLYSSAKCPIQNEASDFS